MKQNGFVALLLVVSVVCLSLSDIAFAGVGIHGAKAAGMGTAFIGLSDDPSALMFNPAGITQINGSQAYSGGTVVIPSTTYKSPSGQSEHTDPQVFFPPFLYAVSDAGTKDLRLGVGVSSPFGYCQKSHEKQWMRHESRDAEGRQEANKRLKQLRSA